MISDLNFTGTGYDTLLGIVNTDLYFRIEYSFFSTADIGVYILNASHAIVQHNIAINANAGIYIDSSDNFLIQNNTKPMLCLLQAPLSW